MKSRVDRRPTAALGLRVTGRSIAGLGMGLLVALVVGVGGTVLATVLGLGHEAVDAADAFTDYPDLALLTLLLGQAFVLQGIGEEVLFRGYLLQTLNRWPRAAVGIHGGFHVSTDMCFALGVTVQGPGLWLVLGTGHLVVGVLLMAVTPSDRWRQIAIRGTYAP